MGDMLMPHTTGHEDSRLGFPAGVVAEADLDQ
jgi:hypothetical protein